MPKFSSEGRIGLIMEIAVIILDRLHITPGYIIWPLFIFGALLIADWILRGEWRGRHAETALQKRVAIYSLSALICLGGLAGWLIYRLKTVNSSETVKNVQPQHSTPQLPTPVQPMPERDKSISSSHEPIEKHPSAQTKSKPQSSYSVTNPSGSIINQASPNYGKQIINNVPPSRVRSDEQLAAFEFEFNKVKHGAIRVVFASSADDVFPLSQQICAVALRAKWGTSCPLGRNSQMGREAVADGLQCYSDNWSADDARAFKKAMIAAELECNYHPMAYDFGDGIQIEDPGGVALIIGSPK